MSTGSYTYNPNVSLVNGQYRYSFSPNGTIAQLGLGAVSAVVQIPTSVTTIATTGLTTPGFMFVQSLDATNYVEIGSYVSSVFYPLVQVLPGEFAIFRLVPGIALAMQANTAAVQVSYTIQEA